MRTFGDVKLYEIPEVAAALGIHPVTARRYLAEGRIPARKLGRSWLVAEDALQALFKAYGTPGAATGATITATATGPDGGTPEPTKKPEKQRRKQP